MCIIYLSNIYCAVLVYQFAIPAVRLPHLPLLPPPPPPPHRVTSASWFLSSDQEGRRWGLLLAKTCQDTTPMIQLPSTTLLQPHLLTMTAASSSSKPSPKRGPMWWIAAPTPAARALVTGCLLAPDLGILLTHLSEDRLDCLLELWVGVLLGNPLRRRFSRR